MQEVPGSNPGATTIFLRGLPAKSALLGVRSCSHGLLGRMAGRSPCRALRLHVILPGVSVLSRIVIAPTIWHGKPVIRGLRYPVESMLEYLAAGDSIDELLEEFPDLERDDLLACLQYAAMAVKLKTLRLPSAV